MWIRTHGIAVLLALGCNLELGDFGIGETEADDEQSTNDEASDDGDVGGEPEDGDDDQGPVTSAGGGSSDASSSTSGASPTVGEAGTSRADTTGEPGSTGGEGAPPGPDPTGAPVDCSFEPTCEACIGCAGSDGVCAELYDACSADPACAALRACALPCAALTLDVTAYEACLASCETEHVDGVTRFEPLLQCVQIECGAVCVS